MQNIKYTKLIIERKSNKYLIRKKNKYKHISSDILFYNYHNLSPIQLLKKVKIRHLNNIIISAFN